MAVIKLEANIPITVAFTYPTGKESPSQLDGKMQFFRKTVSGDSIYLSPFMESKLVQMGYRAREPVTLLKRGSGPQTRYEVYRPDEAPERPLAGQPNAQPPAATPANVAPPPRSTPPVNGASTGTAATVMQNCLKTAVDMAVWTVQYAKGKELLLAPEFAAIKEIANTLFIQHSKAGNIRQMHDNLEHLAHVTRPSNGSNAEFAEQGSQAAVNAVAQRKIAEARRQFTDDLNDGSTPPIYSVEEDGPPPAWIEEELRSQDLSFLGDTQRAV